MAETKAPGDEVAGKREEKLTQAEREQKADFDPNGADPKAKAEEGQSLAEMQENGQGEEDDGQLFVWEKGRKVTLGTLISRGTAVEHVFVFGGRRTKGTGGLMAFDDNPIMVVRGKPGPVKVVPTRDEEEKVVKVTVESHVEARVVRNADSDDGLELIGHILDDRGYKRPKA